MKQFTLSQDELSLVLDFVSDDGRALMPLRRVSCSLLVAVNRRFERGYTGPKVVVETPDDAAAAQDGADDTRAAVLLSRALEAAQGDPPWLCLVGGPLINGPPRRLLCLLARHGCVQALQSVLDRHHCTVADIDAALLCAVRGGHPDVLDCPALQRGLRLGTTDRRDLLLAACESGHAAVLDRLARPPFAFPSGQTPPFLNGTALSVACKAGNTGIVDRLVLPPFSVDENHAVNALGHACGNGHADVVDRLAAPPFSLGRQEARDAMALSVAAHNGHAAVVKRLALPPYSLGHEDARANGCRALQGARRNGHRDVVALLALPPFAPAAAVYRE